MYKGRSVSSGDSVNDHNFVALPFGEAAPIMALITTRPVSKGEELLISYGHSYWIEQLLDGVAASAPRVSRVPSNSDAVLRAAAGTWGEGLDAKLDRLSFEYAREVRVLEGLLAKGVTG